MLNKIKVSVSVASYNPSIGTSVLNGMEQSNTLKTAEAVVHDES